MNSTKPHVAYIGLGAMGSRMARRILDAGFPLTVFNRSPGAMKPLVDAAAKPASSAVDAARGADIVCSSLTDDDAVRSVIPGVLDVVKKDAVVVEMSTISVTASKQLHDEAKRRGVAYLDAPVSGSTPQAQAGQLVILCGGESSAFERAKPVLDATGKSAVLLGPGGSGSLAKLCINAMLAMGLQSLAEALALGERGGLDRKLLLETIGQTAVASPGMKAKFENAVNDDYPPAFKLKLIAKDLGLVLEQAKVAAVSMPQTAAAATAVNAAMPADAEKDCSVLLRHARSRS